MEDLILIYVVSLVISLIVAFFIIKAAVFSAIKAYNQSKYSGNDIEIRLTKLISEIAKIQGLDQKRINEILNDDSKTGTIN
jgi:hypothetical protein